MGVCLEGVELVHVGLGSQRATSTCKNCTSKELLRTHIKSIVSRESYTSNGPSRESTTFFLIKTLKGCLSTHKDSMNLHNMGMVLPF